MRGHPSLDAAAPLQCVRMHRRPSLPRRQSRACQARLSSVAPPHQRHPTRHGYLRDAHPRLGGQVARRQCDLEPRARRCAAQQGPPGQLLAAIADVLNGGVHFHVFRSLCGMLASSGGLTLRVVQRQRQASLAPCGARRSAENPLRRNLRRLPADVDRAGTGGSRHDLFWFHEVSEDPRPYLTIPVLESLAVGCGLLAFLEQAVPGRAGRMCASSCAPTPSPLCSPSQRAPLRGGYAGGRPPSPRHRQVGTLFLLLAVTLLYGDYNPAADFVSRRRWPELWQLCALLGFLPSP